MTTLHIRRQHVRVGVHFLLLKVSVLAALMMAVVACDKSVDPVVPDNDVLPTLNSQGFGDLIVPITSVVHSTSNDDLVAMSAFFADKSIVALGESTHGTSEFFTLRQRMIQHMVEQLNFRVLAIETNFASAQAINEYIMGGPGSAVEAVQNIGGWVYDCKEFVSLVQWLREHNNAQSAANKVTVYGFDAQSAEAAAKRVQAYVAAYDPTYLPGFVSTSAPFLNDFAELSNYSPIDLIRNMPVLVAAYQRAWDSVAMHLQANKAALIAQSGDRAYDLTMRHWEIVQQTFKGFSYIEDELGYFNYRDTYMADNVDWIRKYENNAGMIVWAHVGHASTNNSPQLGTQMGYHLKQRHQSKYCSVGFFTNGGTVRVVHIAAGTPLLGEARIDPKPEHVLSNAFARGKWSQFFLPMSMVTSNTELRKLFLKPQPLYFIGADLEKSTVEVNLGADYDAIVFVEKTSATKPN